MTIWIRMAEGRRRLRDLGVNMIEVVGLVIVSAMVIVGLGVALGVPLPQGLAAAVCKVTGGTDCGEGNAPADARPGPATSTPCEAFCPGPDNPIVPTDPTVAATKGNYVAMGDSYSSGEGAQNYDPESDKNSCHRSGDAYSQNLGRAYDFQGDKSFVACSGAVTDDFFNDNVDPDRGKNEKPQLDDANLSQKTTMVTLTIGGNDLGFGKTVEACFKDPDAHWPWNDPAKVNGCTKQEDEIRQKMKTLFGPPEPSKYTKTLEAIHEKAPNARVVVTGYPLLFPDPPHDGRQTFNKVDQEFLNKMGKEVNEQIRQHVEALDRKYYGHGEQKMGSFEFVDPTPAFKGHQLSDDDEWINSVYLNCNEAGGVGKSWKKGCVSPGSIHPNAKGQRALSDLLSRQIQNGPGRTLYDP